MIQHIEEGMTWQQVFAIINEMIDKFNGLYGATEGVVVDGHIDYNVITNKPSINGVELVGNKTQADINVQIDSETQTALNTLGGRVSVVEEDLTETVTTEELDTELQPYAKTTDLPDMTGYYTKQQVDTSLGQKVDTSTYNTQVQQLSTAINSKADAGEVPTVAQWQVLRSEMESKVTQAGNSASTAASAASAAVEEAIQDLPNNTTIHQIVSKVNEIVERSNTLSAAECGIAPLDKCLVHVQQLVINS